MKKLVLIVSVFVLVIIMGCIRPEEKVLLIFSYHPEYPWVVEETRGVETVLENKGIEIDKFYLDTKRRTSAEWKHQVSQEAIQKIEEFKPDLVMVFDDNACELVAEKYIGRDLPFVFCGMNNEPGHYGFPAQNITGVIEQIDVAGSIDLLRELAPGVQRVAILTDNSPTSLAFVAGLGQMSLPVDICEIYTTDDFTEWKAHLQELQYTVDAIGLFLYHTVKETGQEISLPAETVLQWTIENNDLPEFACLDFTVKAGALCGVTSSGYEQGKTAAEITLSILEGEKPATIPIASPQSKQAMVNETRAKELGLRIPETLRNRVEVVQ